MSKTDSLNMLKFLDVLLKHGNFTRAAKDLYISQPYLTQTIKNAEKELGISIINRDSSPLELTDAGRVYYQYLNSLENEKDKFQKQIIKYSSPNNIVLRIGVLSSLGFYLLPLFVPDYLKVHPETKIELTEDISEKNELRLLNGDLDFLVGQNPETIAPGLTILDRGKDSYYSVIPSTSKFFQKGIDFINPGSIDVSELLKEQLVLSPHGSSIRRQVDFLFQKHKIEPNVVIESTNINTIQSFVKSGLGVTFLPASVYMKPNGDEYNIYPLPQSLISLNYFIAYPADKTLSQNEKDLVTLFLTNLESSLEQISTIM